MEVNELGRHHKFNPSQTTKGRIALMAVATGAVSTAGAGGAAAAQHSGSHSVNYALASDAEELPASSPQILAISEFKPATGIEDQLGKAVKYASERAEAAKAALLTAQSSTAPGQEGSSTAVANALGAVKPAIGVFTSAFEVRWGTFHKGVDIANAEGTPIRAVLDGTVIDSGPASGFGQWIRIRHDDGTVTVYGHMSTLSVSVGERVTAGQVIAGMGSLGFSTGPHLHFEVHPAGGDAIDPVPWLAAHGISL
ncbi:M23 family metallopeptidase [Corynebacterium sp. zg-331]|uniref:M23 family metallopeptidase n=1 Tax=unclassified Corynebacterium TaxID=2624378 RepID=UPI00128E23E3|nr:MULTISPECIES: M23 family metallopeptidase [unclassified Corynebacterium]MBC3186341.1 M23 family metallopeptidase [Corynebacterium sp. zg-331]MPV52828.1 peptidoglycan DD-metalloendopeptidase family protein [Corynebacterium sp. zg331]